jgi:hypothetical protein
MATLLRTLTAAGLLALGGCTTGSSNTLAGAATMTALAAGSAVANRASGGCIAVCTNGTICNPKSGLCQRLPCRGECGADERCEENFTGWKCVQGAHSDVASQAKASTDTKLPVASPADTSSSSGPPVVVPKAEQAAPASK